MKKVFIVVGAPYSGSTTHTEFLAHQYRLSIISKNKAVEKAIENKTQYGLLAATFVKQKRTIPDDILCNIIWDEFKLKEEYTEGFVFDGFPKNHNQSQELDKFLEQRQLKVSTVFWLDGLSLQALFDRQAKKYEGKERPQHENTKVLYVRKKAYIRRALPMIAFYEKLSIDAKEEVLPKSNFNTNQKLSNSLVCRIHAGQFMNQIKIIMQKRISRLK